MKCLNTSGKCPFNGLMRYISAGFVIKHEPVIHRMELPVKVRVVFVKIR